MTNKPFFSIVIPTYNRADFIQHTIASILSQDFTDFELLVVDDGSTDNTEEVVSSIKDARLQYLKKNNAERAAARNYGAQKARGQYVNFFDSDDLAYPNHLTVARDFIDKHASPEIFHLSYDIKNVKGEVARKIDPINDLNREIIRGNFLSCNGVFIKREVIIANPFNEDRALSSLEDWELWIRMAARYQFRHTPVVTTSVIHHDERSVFGTNTDKIKQKGELFIKYVLADERNRQTYGNHLREAVASAKTYVALHLAMAKGNKKEIWRYFKEGISHYPPEIFRKRSLVIVKLMLGI